MSDTSNLFFDLGPENTVADLISEFYDELFRSYLGNDVIDRTLGSLSRAQRFRILSTLFLSVPPEMLDPNAHDDEEEFDDGESLPIHNERHEELDETYEGDATFLEPITGRFFRSSIAAVKEFFDDFVMNEVIAEGFGTVNDLCAWLGISGIAGGDMIGWTVNNPPKLELVETSNDNGLYWTMVYSTEYISLSIGKPEDEVPKEEATDKKEDEA